MKKLLTLGLVLSAGLVLAGCGSSTPTDDAVAPVVEVATGVVEAPVVEAATGTEVVTGVVEATTGAEVATGN